MHASRYMDPLTSWNYDDIVQGAQKLNSLRTNPKFLDQLDEDWLARKGFTPNLMSVYRGVPDEVGLEGFQVPRWSESDYYTPRFGTDSPALSSYYNSTVQGDFPEYRGGSAVVVSPTGALNRQSLFDTMRHEMRHNANELAHYPVDRHEDEQIVNYLDSFYERDHAHNPAQERMEKLQVDPTNPRIKDYISGVNEEKAQARGQSFIPAVDTLRLVQERMNGRYPERTTVNAPQQGYKLTDNYVNPLGMNEADVARAQYKDPAKAREETLSKRVDANGVTRYSTKM